MLTLETFQEVTAAAVIAGIVLGLIVSAMGTWMH